MAGTTGAGRPTVLAFANRLPLKRTRGGWRAADGGLVRALRPALEKVRSVWIGWDGGAADVPRELAPIELHPIQLSRAEVDGFYHGFSNRTLWPLFHDLPEHVELERRWWRSYRAVNEAFAAAQPVADPDALYWVHDYHLALLPALLRSRGPARRIGFFLHIPFPAPELFARLPWRDHLLEGMLGADVVAFQAEQHRDNFLRACRRLRDDLRVDETAVLIGERCVETAVHPIAIDARGFAGRATAAPAERILRRLEQQFAGRRVLVGVDRVDYTKGLVERLRAIELLLEHRRDLVGKVAFLQIAVPSRGDIREYRALRTEVERLVGRINGRFTEPGGEVPVYYLHRSVSLDWLLACYRLADVCLVTPLRDGMNLVAKEYVAAKAAGDRGGVLVLSEFAGAAEQLPEALRCNPYDVEGLAGTIDLALELEEEDARRRLEKMAARCERHDVFWWLDRQLDAIEGVRERRFAEVPDRSGMERVNA
jgi:trehalose 6-phosphate synthase